MKTCSARVIGGLVTFGVAALLVLAGCERVDIPPDVLSGQIEQTTQPAETPRPTTQELVEGSRVPVLLDSLPLQMRVPPQWKITRHGTGGSIVWLQGPTPSGEAAIQLRDGLQVPKQEFETLLAGARRDRDTGEPDDTEWTVRDLNAGAILVDRRSVGQPMTIPMLDATGVAKLDDKGEILTQTTVPKRWYINVYVPQGDAVDNYALSFVDLSQEQFEQDKAFLESLIASLQYIGPAASAAPATQPATQPALPG